MICDKCNEEFYAPKVEFSDESYGQKRHSCSNFDKENIKDNVLHTKPSPTDHQLEGKVLKKEGCARWTFLIGIIRKMGRTDYNVKTKQKPIKYLSQSFLQILKIIKENMTQAREKAEREKKLREIEEMRRRVSRF